MDMLWDARVGVDSVHAYNMYTASQALEHAHSGNKIWSL